MKLYLKRICSVLLFLSLLLGSFMGWKYILCDDTSSYTRIMMHELYHPDANIDIAFVGSSHVYRSIDPSVTDRLFNCYTFNAGSSSQRMDGSFAIIQELCKRNSVKQVYLELYHGVCSTTAYADDPELTATYILSDYMKPSFNKLNYLLHASSKSYWVNSFLPFRRNWDNLFNLDDIRRVIQAKSTESYKNYEWVPNGSSEYYAGKGFVGNDSAIDIESLSVNANAYGEIPVPDADLQTDWLESLLSIIRFCNQNQIELVFFIAPEPESTVVGKGNYQQYHDYIQQIADRNDIPFFDFNLVRETFLDTNDWRLFKDEDHLNTTGAEVFSVLFSDFFMGKIARNDLFYDSYSEKLLSREPQIYGVAGSGNNSEDGEKQYKIVSNRSSGIQCRITAQADDGTIRRIQDFSDNLHFSLPSEERGILTIDWCMSGSPKKVRTLCVEY